jgi:RNA polymerase sigma-70 factor (ECF subfamily)
MPEPADPATTPDLAFEKRWALTLLDHVLCRLREEFVTANKREHFDSLKVFVWGNPANVSHGEVAAKLGITPNAVSVTVHRLRRRFGELLRNEVAQTVATPGDIDDELCHLMEVFGS